MGLIFYKKKKTIYIVQISPHFSLLQWSSFPMLISNTKNAVMPLIIIILVQK